MWNDRGISDSSQFHLENRQKMYLTGTQYITRERIKTAHQHIVPQNDLERAFIVIKKFHSQRDLFSKWVWPTE